MGTRHSHKWLPSPVSPPASPELWATRHMCQKPKAPFSTAFRDTIPARQKRHRGDRPQNTTRSILHLLRRTKERWRPSAYTGPPPPKHVPERTAVSHAADGRCTSFNRTKRLVCHSRFERCIFPCANCPTTSSFSTLPLRGSLIPIQGVTLWPIPGPAGIYKMHARGSCSTSPAGHARPPLPGRLASPCSVSRASQSEHSETTRPYLSSWPLGELREEHIATHAVRRLHRYPLKFNLPTSMFNSGKNMQHTGTCEACHVESDYSPLSATPPCGYASCCYTADTAGEITSQTFPALAEDEKTFSPNTEKCTGVDHAQGRCFLAPVGAKTVSSPRRTPRAPSGKERSHHHRCQPVWLGRCVEPQRGTRHMAGRAPSLPHKLLGTASCLADITTLPKTTETQTCPGANGQHVDSLSYQPSGRSEVTNSEQPHSEDMAVGKCTLAFTKSDSCAGEGKPGSGCSVSGETSPGGMASEPRSGPNDLEHVREGGGGPVRHPNHNSLSEMVCSTERSRLSGARCSSSPVAESKTLCIPSFSSLVADAPKDSTDQPTGPSNCTIPCSQSLVLPPPGTADGATLPSTCQGRPADTPGRPAVARSPPEAETVGLALGSTPNLLDCSEGVRDTILNARAPSTRLLYGSRWKYFSIWCSERNLDPLGCSVNNILEFLQGLLVTGRSVSTLRGYVATMSAYKGKIDGMTVGTHHLIIAFLKGAKRLHPPRKCVIPQWDLNLVLTSVCSPPYEPLEGTDIKWLSMKTAFLIAIASAKRVGELHALSVSPQCLQWGPDLSHVTLWPNPTFLPKVLGSDFVNKPLTLPSFSSSDTALNTSLCPVRALRQYVTATSAWRTTDQLFVRFSEKCRGAALSKDRLSHWITDTITYAYSSTGREVPLSVKCHSTRSVSTSWAALRGVSLTDICSAASWTSPCTFSRFYRVNVASNSCVQAVLSTAPPVYST